MGRSAAPEQTRILVIDDESPEREVLTQALRREGYQVVGAEDGAHGMDEVARVMPDVVVLDLSMPAGAALDVCRSLRGVQDGPRPAIFMLGSKGEEIDCVVGLEMGADECLFEPYSAAELVGSIRACLADAHRAEL